MEIKNANTTLGERLAAGQGIQTTTHTFRNRSWSSPFGGGVSSWMQSILAACAVSNRQRKQLNRERNRKDINLKKKYNTIKIKGII